MMDKYEVYSDQGQVGLLAFVCLGLSVWCGYEIVMGTSFEAPLKWQLIFGDSRFADVKYMFGFLLAIFGPVSLYGLRRFFSSKPILTIDYEGIYDRRNMKTTVPWAAIEEMKRYNSDTLDVLALRLNEDGRRNLKTTWAQKVNKPFYAMIGVKGLALHLNGLEIDHPEFEAALVKYQRVRPQSFRFSTHPQTKRIF